VVSRRSLLLNREIIPMWRWVALVLVVVAVSAGAAWISMSVTPAGADPADVPFPVASKSAGPTGKVVIEGDLHYDFGVMAQQQKGHREIVLRNEGPGDLTIQGVQPSCSCTVTNLQPGEKRVLKPGETFSMNVEWQTKDFKDAFEKQARVLTSDPEHPEVLFVVKGRVTPAIMTLPEEGVIDARAVVNTEPHVLYAAIASPDRPEMKILNITTSRPELLEVSQRPLSDEERRMLRVDNGHRLEITIKPQPVLGAFNEEIVVKTDHPLKEEVRLTVAGKVVGPISAQPPAVRMPAVSSSRGESVNVKLWVLGQDQTHFEVASAPENLKVAVAPADDKAQARTAPGRAYQMTVTVPPGTSPRVIEEPIILKTDHPQASEVKLPVYIVVPGEG
jgi:hypothetical protein